jgi:hypothetical protein
LEGNLPISDVFSERLREGLRKRYGRLPSAAFVAIHFNRRSKAEKPISQETMRRWIRGISMPGYQHLFTLSTWLTLNVNEISISEIPEANGRSLPLKIDYPEETLRLTEWFSKLPLDTKGLLFKLMSK